MTQNTSLPTTAGTSQAAPVFSVQFVWRAFKHCWKVVVPAIVVLALISNMLALWLFVPEYKAYTRLRIKAARDSILGATRGSSGKNDEFAQNQLAIIRSELVLEPVIAIPEIAQIPELADSRDPLAELAKRLKISNIGKGSEYYEVSFSAENRKHAKQIVDEVTKSYLALFGDIEHQRTTSIQELLQKEKATRESQVQALENTMRELARTAGGQLGTPTPVLDLKPGQLPTNISVDGQLSPELISLQAQRASAEIDMLIVQSQIAEYTQKGADADIVIDASAVDSLLEQNPEILKIEADIGAAQTNLTNAQNTVAEKDPARNPMLKPYARELERQQNLLKEKRLALRPSIEEALRQSERKRREDEFAQLQSKDRNLRILLAALNEQYDKQIKSVKELASETMLDIEFTQLELAYAHEMLGTINSRLMNIEVEKNEPSQVENVFSKTGGARMSTEPNEMLPFKFLGAATAGSILFPMLFMILWEHRARRISDVQEFQENTGLLSVVAEVPRLPVRTVGRHSSIRTKHELWLFEESVESLRTCLMLTDLGRSVQVIAVTSAAAREGKTSVASQLAVSIAGATGQPTLLIDGDLRSPDVNGIFGVDSELGVTDVLAKKVALEEAVCSTWQENLSILPAGRLERSPHNLMAKGAFENLLEIARLKYAFIVIDTAPVLAASESLIMAKEADATLMCAMRSTSRMHQVRSAHSRLTQAGVRPVGLVLNGVSTQDYYYKYGKYAYGS